MINGAKWKAEICMLICRGSMFVSFILTAINRFFYVFCLCFCPCLYYLCPYLGFRLVFRRYYLTCLLSPPPLWNYSKVYMSYLNEACQLRAAREQRKPGNTVEIVPSQTQRTDTAQSLGSSAHVPPAEVWFDRPSLLSQTEEIGVICG